MTEEQARQFAEFVKDHDKRFEAKARQDGNQSAVLLTLASDGSVLEPVSEIEEYRKTQIEENDPGPTVKAAWDTWQGRVLNGGANGG